MWYFVFVFGFSFWSYPHTEPGPVDNEFTDAGSESSPVLLREAGLDQHLLLLEDIKLSETSQTQKNKYFMIPLTGDT